MRLMNREPSNQLAEATIGVVTASAAVSTLTSRRVRFLTIEGSNGPDSNPRARESVTRENCFVALARDSAGLVVTAHQDENGPQLSRLRVARDTEHWVKEGDTLQWLINKDLRLYMDFESVQDNHEFGDLVKSHHQAN